MHLFKMSVTFGLQSLLPILLWYVMGFISGDNELVNGFMLTYPFQFVYVTCFGLIVVGTIKHHMLGRCDKATVRGSVLASFLVMVLMCCVVCLSIDWLCSWFNCDNKDIILFGCFNLAVDIIICSVSRIMEFENQDSFWITVKYYAGRIVIAALIWLVFKNLILISVCFFIYAVILAWRHLKGFKISSKVFSGIRYEISESVYSIGMLITYLFGVGNLSGIEGVLFSYNVMSLCTDTQWDILSIVIDTDSSKKFSKGDFKLSWVWQYVVFSVVLLCSSALMILVSSIFIDFDLKLCFQFFIIECICFPLCAIVYFLTSYTVLWIGSQYIAVVNTIKYIIRVLLTVSITSKFGVSIACLVAVLLGIAGDILVFMWGKRVGKVYCRQEEQV